LEKTLGNLRLGKLGGQIWGAGGGTGGYQKAPPTRPRGPILRLGGRAIAFVTSLKGGVGARPPAEVFWRPRRSSGLFLCPTEDPDDRGPGPAPGAGGLRPPITTIRRLGPKSQSGTNPLDAGGLWRGHVLGVTKPRCCGSLPTGPEGGGGGGGAPGGMLFVLLSGKTRRGTSFRRVTHSPPEPLGAELFTRGPYGEKK